MKKIAALFGFVSLLLLTSQCTPDHPIQGVWIPKASYDYGNTLYDFQANGSLKIHDVTITIGDSIKPWKVVNDSTLTIGDKLYTYKMNDPNHLEFVEQDDFAQHSMVKLRRPQKTNITKSKEEIEQILLSKIWSIQDTSIVYWETHLEYFDNQTMVYRYQLLNKDFVDSEPIDSLDNLHLESWKIDHYKDYYFLHFYRNTLLGNGGSLSFHQVLDIENETYTLSDSRAQPYRFTYISKLYTPAPNQEKAILGKWQSWNSKDKRYRKYPDQYQIKKGYTKLYEGPLYMNIEPKSIQFALDTLRPDKATWQIGKDGRTLLLEYQIDEPDRVGIHVDYADIVDVSENTMKLRLYYNVFFAASEKPRRIYVNQLQEFQKME
jgi:hypothetical protein